MVDVCQYTLLFIRRLIDVPVITWRRKEAELSAAFVTAK